MFNTVNQKQIDSRIGRLASAMPRWRRSSDATVAIEFSLLAVPFFFLLMGTVEVCLAYASGYLLEGGVITAGRFVRTGQAIQQADPQTAFEDRLCELTSSLINCDEIVYEAIIVDSFSDAEDNEPVFDGDGNMVSQGFSPGDASETILIRASFRYQFKTPLVSVFMPSWNGGDDSMLFMSTYVIRNEPFTF